MESISAEIKAFIHRGIDGASIDGDGHLIFTLTDGSVRDLGNITGPRGEKGDTGETGPAPYVGENGNWFTSSGDTGVRAVEEAFELINTVTTDQLCSYVSISEDSNGAPFYLKKARVYCMFPASELEPEEEGAGKMRIAAWTAGETSAFLNMYIDDVLRSEDTQLLFEAEKTGGLWNISAALGNALQKQVFRGDDFSVLSKEAPPSGVSIMRFSRMGLVFIPEGSTFQLWGIRDGGAGE